MNLGRLVLDYCTVSQMGLIVFVHEKHEKHEKHENFVPFVYFVEENDKKRECSNEVAKT